MTKTPTWTEELVSDTTGESRGAVQFKEKGDRLYGLIGRRWCRCERREDGKIIEIWVR